MMMITIHPRKIYSSIDKNTKEISPNIDLYIDIKRDIEVKRENYISGSQFDDQPCTRTKPTKKKFLN